MLVYTEGLVFQYDNERRHGLIAFSRRCFILCIIWACCLLDVQQRLWFSHTKEILHAVAPAHGRLFCTEVSATLCMAGFNIAILAEGRVHHDHQRKRLTVT